VAKLTILEYPDPRLRTVAKPVTVFDSQLRTLVVDMAETMYAAPGIGLAATQVDRHIQLIVIDVSESKDQLRVFINPTIVQTSEETALCEEGCLSVPGVYDEVRRVQHEMDHLSGKVFVDYLSALKQDRIRTKLKKRKVREAA